MTSDQQKDARTMFFQTDLTKTQIAEQLGIPRHLLHSWIKQNNWERQKKSAAIMPSLLAENCYHLIARFTQQLMTEDRIMRPITRHESDTLYKLTLTANKLKKSSTLNETMELFGLFMERVDSKSPEMAQAMIPFVEDFISTQSEKNLSSFRPEHANTMGLVPMPEQDIEEEKLDVQDIVEWSQNGFPAVPPEAVSTPEPQPYEPTDQDALDLLDEMAAPTGLDPSQLPPLSFSKEELLALAKKVLLCRRSKELEEEAAEPLSYPNATKEDLLQMMQKAAEGLKGKREKIKPTVENMTFGKFAI